MPQKQLTKIHFSKKELETLNVGVYKDTQVRYLYLRVGKTKKTFVFYRRIPNRKVPFKKKLGEFPLMSISQARNKVHELNVAIHQGTLLSEGSALNDIAFCQLWDLYRKEHLISHTARPEDDHRIYLNHMQRWYQRKINTVTKLEVQEWINEVAKDPGVPTALRCHSLFRSCINWAIGKQVITCVNPATGVRRPRYPGRERFLSREEASRLFKALDNYSNQDISDILRLCLWTAQRRGNVQSMAWRELDLENAMWMIPSRKFKTRKSHTVELSEESLEILRQRAAEKKSRVWVFPSYGKNGYVTELKNAWKVITAEAELEDFHIHDLRHTMASWMAINGVPLQNIGKALGHASIQSTQRYAHLTRQSVRNAFKAASQFISSEEVDI